MTQILNEKFIPHFPATPFGLYLSLFWGNCRPHHFWDSAHFRNKFFLRTMLMPGLTFKLLKMIAGHQAYKELLLSQPRLPCRIHRPYLSNRVSRREGVDAIIHHYTTVTALLGMSRFRTHLSAEGLCLAAFEGKDEQTYLLTLVSTYKLDREGEASLILRRQNGQMLAELSFTLCQRKGENALIIGGLQGPNGVNAQENIQQATKGFHGLFPKRVVLESLMVVAKYFNVQSIYAVANDAHVYQSLRYANRKQYMHADYDSFWEMSGGIPTGDGYYLLPSSSQRKNLEEVASKKRAEYRRRFELIDTISAQILSAIR
ncbi:DUF535 domain-containing protein [Chimaeribacter coloradensis]|uniref:DUF535 domain-containing protein n=1 Tax=Chimaeribacter coloradensis TaxID=2060068 RepID=A0A2N5E3Z9_9GAMM|nr:VirK/YbjX family protein [Chimaeribacter coloradensis]PLR35555.1 DUF535 domain-containing protein [Chimaeribacter coloradensis]